ncbi:MAG TPA: carbon starvation protein A [bacterium]|nr:carbon starvation protein A [bacterium]
MPAILLVILSSAVFAAGYRIYGRFLNRRLDIDPHRSTPAHTRRDGVDYVPARSPVLLGHHFASIAGAGPILGPIYAAVFGWLPVFIWIVIGSLFFGGVHDFASIVASIRHGGRSIGEVIEEYIGRSGKQLFLIFAWFMLILVVAVFCKAVAGTFTAEPSSAGSSFLFIVLAVLFGLSLYRLNLRLGLATALGVVLLFGCVILGLRFPITLSYNTWMAVLFGYIFVASVTPVWILLQPRDFLNSFLLYAVLLGSVAGIFITNPVVAFPALGSFHSSLGPMFPILFVTVACGAISGFHSMVSSGTTSKQLDNENDARPVGYGGMLIEGVLAVVALITATVLLQGDYAQKLTVHGGGPIGIFASGVGGFIATLGIPSRAAVTFAALAISAFALTSLDTATRLGRFIVQEFFDGFSGWPSRLLSKNRFIPTLLTIGAAAGLALTGTGDTLWPLFGSANQLLAAIVLLAITVWLARLKKKTAFTRIPMVFMFLVTLAALASLIVGNLKARNWTLFSMGIILMSTALVLVVQALRSLRFSSSADS